MKKFFAAFVLLLTCSLVYSQYNTADFISTSSGLKYKVTQKGTGIVPVAGDKVQVHYTGKLENDTVFDSSIPRGNPFEFELGAGQVIKGWDEGIALLNEGSKAILYIPSNIGYGARAQGKIPANATLIFEVELVKVIPGVKILPYDIAGKQKQTTVSGLTYYVIDEGPVDAPYASVGKNVKVNYSAFLADGKMFDSSVKRGQPVGWEVGTGPLKGFDEGISMMKVGDKFKLEIPPQLAFGERQIPNVPANSTIFIDVELIEVTTPVKITAYDCAGKDTVTLNSGLKYIVVQSNDGKKAKFGKKIKVHYTGYFDNGTIFDSSVKRGTPIEFTLGAGQVIKGWDEGITLMKQGEKYRLIIPYYLAYGEQGRSGIPPKSQLTFDVELIDVGY